MFSDLSLSLSFTHSLSLLLSISLSSSLSHSCLFSFSLMPMYRRAHTRTLFLEQGKPFLIEGEMFSSFFLTHSISLSSFSLEIKFVMCGILSKVEATLNSFFKPLNVMVHFKWIFPTKVIFSLSHSYTHSHSHSHTLPCTPVHARTLATYLFIYFI